MSPPQQVLLTPAWKLLHLPCGLRVTAWCRPAQQPPHANPQPQERKVRLVLSSSLFPTPAQLRRSGLERRKGARNPPTSALFFHRLRVSFCSLLNMGRPMIQDSACINVPTLLCCQLKEGRVLPWSSPWPSHVDTLSQHVGNEWWLSE